MKITFETEPLTPETSADITLTDSAAIRIKKIQEKRLKKGDTAPYLRVRVNSGGCNGYSYTFLFEKEPTPEDIHINNLGVSVIIDPTSYNYLLGSSIDYVETIEASQFIIHNPNAKTSCGCGSSFSL